MNVKSHYLFSSWAKQQQHERSGQVHCCKGTGSLTRAVHNGVTCSPFPTFVFLVSPYHMSSTEEVHVWKPPCNRIGWRLQLHPVSCVYGWWRMRRGQRLTCGLRGLFLPCTKSKRQLLSAFPRHTSPHRVQKPMDNARGKQRHTDIMWNLYFIKHILSFFHVLTLYKQKRSLVLSLLWGQECKFKTI